jgi:hypothetical protein
MDSRAAHDSASEVTAEEGEVLIDGPDGIALSMTPEAAEETAKRLHESARIAAEQIRNRQK